LMPKMSKNQSQKSLPISGIFSENRGHDVLNAQWLFAIFSMRPKNVIFDSDASHWVQTPFQFQLDIKDLHQADLALCPDELTRFVGELTSAHHWPFHSEHAEESHPN
jgi:hypothetical protein